MRFAKLNQGLLTLDLGTAVKYLTLSIFTKRNGLVAVKKTRLQHTVLKLRYHLGLKVAMKTTRKQSKDHPDIVYDFADAGVGAELAKYDRRRG